MTFLKWFYSLAPRERVMVVAGAIAVAFTVLYYGILQPLNSSLESARSRVVSEADQTRWLLGLREEARLLQASGRSDAIKGRDESLLSIVDATSRDNGLVDAVRRIQPDGNDQATVTLENTNFNQLLYWLRVLQSDYGVSASALVVTGEEEPGMVQARLTLQRGDA